MGPLLIIHQVERLERQEARGFLKQTLVQPKAVQEKAETAIEATGDYI